ncbi:M15 family metallopeptidase [Nocardioides sp. Bht2]|uniref:M15 family metallopeptidase n=1 Tax=Nocardioides sp. Bht2 TaxID=3392297 RepID=UPI0039B45BE9
MEGRRRGPLRSLARRSTLALTVGLAVVLGTGLPAAPAVADDPTAPEQARITLRAPTGVVQGRSATFTAQWQLADGSPIADVGLHLQRQTPAGWRGLDSAVTTADGVAIFTVMPRQSAEYRIAAQQTEQAHSEPSNVVRVKLRPIIAAVKLPKQAPRPRIKLPAQPLAFADGARPVITSIPDQVWREMVGRSWHRGCLPRRSLRLIRVSYWDYGGFRRRGELVTAKGAARQTASAFAALYRAKLPVRSMYRVDRFGWSKRLRGADDYASMAAGNTSAFNCRNVVGRPGVRSPHARGRAVDLNPWENPFASREDGWVPNRWWVGRCHPKVAWCSPSHRVVRTLHAHGLKWTYRAKDRHHFDG